MSSRPVIPHTLQAQLEQVALIHEVERALLKKRQSQDQDDIITAFEADAAWSGQYERLNRRDRDDTSIEP